MYRFLYDCVVVKEDDGFIASFPQLPGCLADGDTREEAIGNAEEALEAYVADSVNRGEALPAYEPSAEVIAISVKMDELQAQKAACCTFKEAALDLTVSPSRITALVKAGKLDVVLIDGHRMITIEGIERYIASGRNVGRPKKFVALS